jgi:hypothetical protein
LNTEFGIKNVSQDYKIGTGMVNVGRGGRMEEMKVREYG